MRGVTFGDNNTATDWSLILNSMTLTPPKPKTNYINVPGRDGALDLSEALSGEITYDDRTASFVFLITEGSQAEREALISEILGAIHGRKLEIVLPDNSDYYLVGRCTITDRKNNKAYGSISVSCECEPWLYAETETVRTVTVTSSSTISLVNNGVKTVTPEIQVTGSVTLKFDSLSIALTTGTYKLTDLKVKSGNKTVKIEGSGTVVFTYREGVL